MPAIHMSDEERDSLFQLAQSPAPPGAIPAEHASRFVALGLAVRETLRFRITLRGQVEILRQRFRKMPLSRVAKVSKKHFLATFEDRFSDRPLLGQRAQPAPREAPRRDAPAAQARPQQPRKTAPGSIPPPNPGLPPQRGRPAAPSASPAPQKVRPGQPTRPAAGQKMRPQPGQEIRSQGGQPLRPVPQQRRNPQPPQGKGPPPRPKR